MPSAQAQTVAPSIQVLQDVPLSDDASKHTVTAFVDWPQSATTGRHTHPGDEYAIVLKGAVEVKTGDDVRLYKAGEAYHNARGVVHETRMVGDEPAQTGVVLVVDKNTPLTQPVP